MLGSPRDFSTARYATVCETTPLPWDPGTPIDQRPAVAQQRIAALPADTFAPFDPPVVVEDEIDLCLRWPDVPRPPATAAPLPYPDRADADPPGRRGPAHAAGVLRARSRRGSRARCGSSCPASATRPSATRAPARRDAIDALRRRQVAARVAVQAHPDRRAGGPRRAGRRSSRCAASAGLPRKIGRTVRALGATLDDLRLVLSPAALADRAAAACAAARGRSAARRLILRDYQAVSGRDGERQRRRDADAARSRRQGRARNGHAALRRAAAPGRSAGARISLRLGAPDVSAAHGVRGLRWRADRPRFRSYCRRHPSRLPYVRVAWRAT